MKYTKSTIFFCREKCIIFSSKPISFYDFYTWQLPRSVLHSPRVPHAKAMKYRWQKQRTTSKKQIYDDSYKAFPNASPNLAFQKTTWSSLSPLTKPLQEKKRKSLIEKSWDFCSPNLGMCKTRHQTIKSHRTFQPADSPTPKGHRMWW